MVRVPSPTRVMGHTFAMGGAFAQHPVCNRLISLHVTTEYQPPLFKSQERLVEIPSIQLHLNRAHSMWRVTVIHHLSQ